MRLWIEAWRKDNEEQYYGLSKDEVVQILNRYEDAIDEIEKLRKALADIAESDDDYYVGRKSMKKLAKEVLGMEGEE